MLDKKHLRKVPLPEDLTNEEIYTALEETQAFFQFIRDKTGINLSSIMQANNFSGMVSNVFTNKLSDASSYKFHHDQKYPDLMYKSKGIGLEVKASIKPLKGGEGHNGHSGWHIVVCYKILDNGDIEFVHVEIADLIGYECPNPDWKYEGSKRNSNNSQRTETYVTTNVGTAKLRDGSVYLNPEYVEISSSLKRRRKAIQTKLSIPPSSPFKD